MTIQIIKDAISRGKCSNCKYRKAFRDSSECSDCYHNSYSDGAIINFEMSSEISDALNELERLAEIGVMAESKCAKQEK